MIKGYVNSNEPITGKVGTTGSITGTLGNNENINGKLNAPIIEDYERLSNKPSINGVELTGNKTTEDLGITAGSDIELIGEIKPESIEEELKFNQVYNGNAIHDLARLFGMTIEGITETIPKGEFDVSCTISLTTMQVTNVSNFSNEIIQKRNEGYLVRMNCSFTENPKLKVVCILNVIDGDWTFFYPVIRGDIGQGMKTYVFRLGVGKTNAIISAHALPENGVDILTEFDIEYTYEDNQVYNANAIHQLLEIFIEELMMMQEEIAGFDERLSDLENK